MENSKPESQRVSDFLQALSDNESAKNNSQEAHVWNAVKKLFPDAEENEFIATKMGFHQNSDKLKIEKYHIQKSFADNLLELLRFSAANPNKSEEITRKFFELNKNLQGLD